MCAEFAETTEVKKKKLYLYIMSQYKEWLLDPKWKRKRKEILKRDYGMCTVCHAKKNLHIHHTFYYDRFIPPWKYPENSLLTICAKCHKEYHEICDVEIKPFPTKKKKRRRKKGKKKQWSPRERPAGLAQVQAERGLRIKRKMPDGTIKIYFK